MELMLVSSHPEKVRELKRILQDILPDVLITPIVDVSLCDQQSLDPFLERSSGQKAVKAVEKFSKPCLADDSGLIVPSLGKEKVWREEQVASGVFLPNTKKILSELKGIKETEREAFLECSLSFATPENGLVRSATCRMEGVIAPKGKGSSSFDFSSIFVKYEYNKTLAELSPSVLSRISHRRKVCEKLIPFLRSYYTSHV
jgi:XTP/dITP diphosphohydrolase